MSTSNSQHELQQRLLQQQPQPSTSTQSTNPLFVHSRSVDSSPVVSPDLSDHVSSKQQPKPLSLEDNENLPNNVSTEAQLALLPDVCLSGQKNRPLRHVNEQGEVSTYALQPMFYSVIFILMVELLERFSFYGVNYTQTSFLTGAYNEEWNANMSAVAASSYVSISTAVAYTMPFVGAFLADNVLGDYYSILFGMICFYIPGLILIWSCSVPYLLGDTFNRKVLSVGLLGLWPMGTGIIKSIVNVFGAKQFHPLLQSSLIESYYVSFYMCINIGALVGGIVVPVVAQYDVTLAYTYPMAMLCIGVLLFLLGTPRYVRQKPAGEIVTAIKNKAIALTTPKIGRKQNHSNTTPALKDDLPSDTIPLSTIFRISMLIVPFNIAYSQMATTFIVQGTVMRKAFGFVDASTMNNADAISVLFFGHVIGTCLYPALAQRKIKIPTTYKFAIGSTLGALAIAWALLIEYLIHSTYQSSGDKVSILWQTTSYVLIGAGEIFAVSAAYEVAFTASSPESKVIASALNLFCVGGIPNVFCILLYNACRGWFRNAHGRISIHYLEDYVTASVYKYFLVLFGIALLGIGINLLPSIKDFVKSIEERATEMVKTPIMKRRPNRARLQTSSSSGTEYSPKSDEESPLLRAKRHEAYLKYGSGPVLYKSGSFRAGSSLRQEDLKKEKSRFIKKSQVGKLYRSTRSSDTRPNVVMTPEGQPLKAGKIAGNGKHVLQRQGSM